MLHFDRRTSRLLLVVAALALAACGTETTGAPDSGRADGGGADASRQDSGSSGEDGGPASDAGADGGSPDAASTADAGAADAGAADAGGGQDACLPTPCAAPPPGCRYVGSTACTCGTLVCPLDCGTEPCDATEYCDYTAPFACGGPGTCRPRPESCIGLYDPVCGCDGVTHGNECTANESGTDVASDGECPSTEDCRTTGCTPPASCEECRGIGGPVYVCLPPGTAC